ncbi:hypothetical protein D3C73_926320 [compost metagenome]
MLRQRLGPGLDISACITAEIVDARPWSHTVELHEVNAPFPKKIGNGVDIPLGAGVAEVDFVGVGVPVIHNFQRLYRNIAYPAFPIRSVDFKVIVIRFNRQARNQINSDLLPVVMHIINNLLKTVRITLSVRQRPPVFIHTAIPACININILIAVRLQLLVHGVRLLLDALCRYPAAGWIIHLHTVAAPAHIWLLRQCFVRCLRHVPCSSRHSGLYSRHHKQQQTDPDLFSQRLQISQLPSQFIKRFPFLPDASVRKPP